MCYSTNRTFVGGCRIDLLFDLQADPRELQDILEERNEWAERLREELMKRLEVLEANKLSQGEYSGVSNEELEQLGYLK